MENTIRHKGSKWRRLLGEDFNVKVFFTRDKEGKHLKGAIAVVSIGGTSYVGFASVMPGDNFSRKIGREVAVGRALKASVNLPVKKSITCTQEQAYAVMQYMRSPQLSAEEQFKVAGDFYYETEATIKAATEHRQPQ